jgi:hypothetical protein
MTEIIRNLSYMQVSFSYPRNTIIKLYSLESHLKF